MMKSVRVLTLLMAGLCLSCGFQSRKSMDPASDLLRQDPLPQDQIGTVAGAMSLEYLLQSGDRLEIYFPSAREQNFVAVVRPDGRITLPLTGDVDAEGSTPVALSKRITQAYTNLLKDPQAQVAVTAFGPQPVYIFGEVANPARYDWTRGLDLVQALSMAGGTQRTAELANVVLVRVGADGAYRFEVHDVRNLVEQGIRLPVILQPRDIVIVPTSAIADMQIWVGQYISTFMPPLDAFLRGRYYWFLASDAANR